MSLPEHLDLLPADLPLAFPAVGEIKAVFPKDHEQNQTGGQFTTYQVQMYWQRPCHSALLNRQVAALGQQAGGDIDWEIPYLVGQKVMVQFLEGDPNRPLIMGRIPDATQSNQVSQDTVDQPQTTISINGARFVVTKEGDVKITMASARSVQCLNQNGDVIADIVENGDVKLGGSTGLNRLIDERAQSLIEGHKHIVATAAGPTVSSGAKDSTGALDLNLSGTLTSKTQAK